MFPRICSVMATSMASKSNTVPQVILNLFYIEFDRLYTIWTLINLLLNRNLFGNKIVLIIIVEIITMSHL